MSRGSIELTISSCSVGNVSISVQKSVIALTRMRDLSGCWKIPVGLVGLCGKVGGANGKFCSIASDAASAVEIIPYIRHSRAGGSPVELASAHSMPLDSGLCGNDEVKDCIKIYCFKHSKSVRFIHLACGSYQVSKKTTHTNARRRSASASVSVCSRRDIITLIVSMSLSASYG